MGVHFSEWVHGVLSSVNSWPGSFTLTISDLVCWRSANKWCTNQNIWLLIEWWTGLGPEWVPWSDDWSIWGWCSGVAACSAHYQHCNQCGAISQFAEHWPQSDGLCKAPQCQPYLASYCFFFSPQASCVCLLIPWKALSLHSLSLFWLIFILNLMSFCILQLLICSMCVNEAHNKSDT